MSCMKTGIRSSLQIKAGFINEQVSSHHQSYQLESCHSMKENSYACFFLDVFFHIWERSPVGGWRRHSPALWDRVTAACLLYLQQLQLLYLHLQLIITLTLLHTFLDCPKTIKSNVGGADICHTFLVSND